MHTNAKDGYRTFARFEPAQETLYVSMLLANIGCDQLLPIGGLRVSCSAQLQQKWVAYLGALHVPA